MKLAKGDKVIVILGKDRGKTGTIVSVIPKDGKVVVENINVIKRHTKPSQKQPRGGILEIAKPIDVSKLMAVDPASGKPARISYTIKADGTKERTFKVSANYDKAAKKVESSKAKAPAKAKSETAGKSEANADTASKAGTK